MRLEHPGYHTRPHPVMRHRQYSPDRGGYKQRLRASAVVMPVSSRYPARMRIGVLLTLILLHLSLIPGLSTYRARGSGPAAPHLELFQAGAVNYALDRAADRSADRRRELAVNLELKPAREPHAQRRVTQPELMRGAA